jgi:hypothetical protein
MKTALLLCAGAALSAASSAQTTTVYSQSFDGALGSEWSGVRTVESVQGFEGKGSAGKYFSGNLLRNASVGAATRLTLTNLPPHGSVNVGFLFAAIDSWDGTGHTEGVTIFNHSFANIAGVGTYNPPVGGLIAGALNPGTAGGRDYGWAGWLDSAYNLHLEPSLKNIPHTASTMVLEFKATGRGWQGLADESWGIDGVVIETGGGVIPAPGAAALGAIALGAAASRRRR